MHDTARAPAGAFTRLRYLPGVDGMRAIAVMSVLAYHAQVSGVRGGFLGVEVFFVISGYLITSLLLSERGRTHHNDLGEFYLRRARRLLPALLLALGAVVFVAVVFLPDEVASLRGDVAASLGYATNWYFVVVEKSYFEVSGRPSLVQHLWSLAVEEQFYLLWPVIFVVGMKVLRRLGMFVAIIAGIVGSVALMQTLYVPGQDPSRVYYGTDTRASALLIGAALAFVWGPWRLRRATGRGAPAIMDLVGVVAMGGLLALLFTTDEFSSSLYQGGFLKVSLLSAVCIAVVAHPATRLGRVVGCRPMRWVGLRSYGIYLYHWPVFQLTRPNLDVPFGGAPLLALRVGLTVGIAALSYRFVEIPVREGVIGHRLARLRHPSTRKRLGLSLRTGALTTACIAALGVLTVGLVQARPPEAPDYLLAGTDPSVTVILPTPTVTAPSATGGRGSASSSISDPLTGIRSALELPASEVALGGVPGQPVTSEPPTPEVPVSTTAPVAHVVTALGDSVMLGAAPVLRGNLPGQITVEAKVGRQVSEGIEILGAWQGTGLLDDVVVVHLGNNGTFAPEQFDAIAQQLSSTRRVIFLTCRVPRAWEQSVNETITAGVARTPNAVLIDWYTISAEHPEWFWDDGMHLRPEGAAAYNHLIATNL